jgi:hypothetical protein
MSSSTRSSKSSSAAPRARSWAVRSSTGAAGIEEPVALVLVQVAIPTAT